jgi:hypothetical protein
VPGCASGRLVVVRFPGSSQWALADTCFGAAACAAPLADGERVCAVHVRLLQHLQRCPLLSLPLLGFHG